MAATRAHAVGAAANARRRDARARDDIHDVTIIEWIAWTPLLIAIVVLGVYPQLMFKVMDPAVTQLVDRIGGRHPVIARAPRPGAGLDPPRRSTGTRSRPRSILVVGINLVLLIDLFARRVQEVDHGHPRRASCCSARSSRSSRSPSIGDDVRSMFDGRYVGRRVRLVLKALFLLVGYVVVLLSQTELEEGGYYQGEYYVLLLVQRARHGDDGVGRDLVSDLRRARAAVDPGLHAGRVAQARPARATRPA